MDFSDDGGVYYYRLKKITKLYGFFIFYGC